MTKPRDSLIWGVILLAIGAGFLIWNLGVLSDQKTQATWAVAGVFAVLGLVYLFSYLTQPARWWRLIPACTLLAVALAIYLLSRQVAETWIAVVMLSGIALAFLVVYTSDRRERWWALIPFGSVGVMVLIALLSTRPEIKPTVLGAALFGGLALVFLLIYALAPKGERFGWPLVPAAALGVMALAALAASITEGRPALAAGIRFWPVALVVLGVLLIGYSITRSTQVAQPVVELPAQPTAAATVVPAAIATPAPNTSVMAVPEEAPAASRRFERSPITLDTAAPAAKPSATHASGEVDDLYSFLESAQEGEVRSRE